MCIDCTFTPSLSKNFFPKKTDRKMVSGYGSDALDMVNDILGVVQDTGYENYVNDGSPLRRRAA
jgi:hypothetical protein